MSDSQSLPPLPADVRVGQLPTMNQDEYPGLGGWWIQLRLGKTGDGILARVYGDSPEQVKERAEAICAALQHAQQADVEAPVKPRVKTLSEVIDGMTRWIEHHEQKAVYAEINVATVMSWRVELSALRADLAAIGERHGRHAASSTEQPGAERALSGAGVFKGAHGLRGLAEAKEFWDQQPYGTRLYYGPGITDYLHRSVLESAVNILDSIQPRDASQQGGVPVDALKWAAQAVCAFDWSDNDDDAVAAIERLRRALRNFVSSTAGAEPIVPANAGKVHNDYLLGPFAGRKERG